MFVPGSLVILNISNSFQITDANTAASQFEELSKARNNTLLGIGSDANSAGGSGTPDGGSGSNGGGSQSSASSHNYGLGLSLLLSLTGLLVATIL